MGHQSASRKEKWTKEEIDLSSECSLGTTPLLATLLEVTSDADMVGIQKEVARVTPTIADLCAEIEASSTLPEFKGWTASVGFNNKSIHSDSCELCSIL